jgi:hypothetical protein
MKGGCGSCMDRTVRSSGGSGRLGAHRDIKRIWALLRGDIRVLCIQPLGGMGCSKKKPINLLQIQSHLRLLSDSRLLRIRV